MKYREYGFGKKHSIILLHGGGLSWWNYKEVAEILQNKYHVILPILDGHADSDNPFSSIEDNAEEIIKFIDEYLGGKVLFIGGLSLGAQILLEMLSQRRDICKFAIVESAVVIPSKLTNALIGTALNLSYGLIKYERFARKQFDALHIKDELFDDYYRDSCAISKHDMKQFLKANSSYTLKKSVRKTKAIVRIYVGSKENSEMIQSAELISKTIRCPMKIMNDMYHGEFSLNHASDYAKVIENMVK